MSVELVEVDRSGFRECVHRGSLVVLDPAGDVLLSLGEVHSPTYPRSASKPLQCAALLRAGFVPADDREIAIATSSHSGEPAHLAVLTNLLARAGVTESQLLCPPDLPMDESARARILGSGGHPRRIFMPCSGQHAAMLATCVARGWPLGGHLDPAHPLQEAIVDTVTGLAGEAESDLGIDGCGLPIVPLSLAALARASTRMVTAEPGSPERAVADAMREHPWLVSGTDRDDLRLMSTVPGLVCKSGADGVHLGALPDGTAFAIKIDDGHQRAVLPLAAALLHRIGVARSEELAALASRPVFGGQTRVGTVRAVPGVLG